VTGLHHTQKALCPRRQMGGEFVVGVVVHHLVHEPGGCETRHHIIGVRAELHHVIPEHVLFPGNEIEDTVSSRQKRPEMC